jgi:hypothetical protein
MIPVDPIFYAMATDRIVDQLLDATYPLLDHGSESTDASALSGIELLSQSAKLLGAVSLRVMERLQEDLAEADLGGGIFDDDVKEIRRASETCSVPQTYSTEERDHLDSQLAFFKTPRSMAKYKTGTKLQRAEITDSGNDMHVRVELEVNAPVEQVVMYIMGHTPTYDEFTYRGTGDSVVFGERPNDHSAVSRASISMPTPLAGREIVLQSVWEKLDEDTFFVTQASCEHPQFPRQEKVVRATSMRSIMLVRAGPNLTKAEFVASASMGGFVPRRVNNTVTIPAIVKSQVSLLKFFAAVIPVDKFSSTDATTLGRIVMAELIHLRANEQVLRDKVSELVGMVNVLRVAQAQYR